MVRLGQSMLVVFKPELTSCTPCTTAITALRVTGFLKIDVMFMDPDFGSILVIQSF